MVADEQRDDMVAACRSVLIEALTILGKHRHYLVVVGGWVPPLLFGDAQHLGSIDVDLAVDWRNAPSYVYETILNELCAAGYRQTDIPNRLERDPTVQESLRRIRAKYSSLDSAGPVWAARVVQESGGDYEFARRDAFERATALLGALGVDPHA